MTITIVDNKKNIILYRDVIEKNPNKVNNFSKVLEEKEKLNSSALTDISNTDTSNNVRLDEKIINPTDKNVSNKNVSNKKPTLVPDNLLPIFKEAGEKYDIDEGILIALARQESNFRHDAVSSAGAVGIMQLMPKTSKSLGVTDPYDPRENIMAGARLLSGHLKKYEGNLSLALAAYGAGGGAVRKYKGIPPYKETMNHIPRVLANYARGYKSDSNDIVKRPNRDYLLDQIIKYKETKGSAFSDGVKVNESQKKDLIALIKMAMEYRS